MLLSREMPWEGEPGCVEEDERGEGGGGAQTK